MHLFLLACALLPAVIQADSECESQSGTCQNEWLVCSGSYWSGKCDGRIYRRCCIPGSRSGDSRCVNTKGGYCKINTGPTSCPGQYLTGQCAGAASRQCCVPGSTLSCSQTKVGRVCQSNPLNVIRGDDSYGSGRFGASRGSRTHTGVDVKCTAGDDVYAPFDATYVRQSIPYRSGKNCCNNGMLLRGTGAWQGYELKLWYIRPKIGRGQRVRAGTVIAKHIGLHCPTCYGLGMTDHTHFELRCNGALVNPTNMM